MRIFETRAEAQNNCAGLEFVIPTDDGFAVVTETTFRALLLYGQLDKNYIKAARMG